MRALTLGIAAGLAGLSLLVLALAGRTGSLVQASTARQVGKPPLLALKNPHAAAHMKQGDALALVSGEFGAGLLQNPHTVAYGSFTDNNYGQTISAGHRQAVGTRDVWEVTVSNLNFGRPCPASQAGTAACPPITNLAILIDDKAGRYLEAVGW